MWSSPIPQLGLGTYGRTGDAGMAAILAGIEAGYRHIDTAQNYETEANVGTAIRRSGLPRDRVFVTTKVADRNLAPDKFGPSVEESLSALGMDQIDLLLIHWPSERDAVPFTDYMGALAEAQARGQARMIGVSNFPILHLERARGLLGDGALATNQVELHPYLQSPNLRDYARSRGLPLTAYEPLVRGRVATDPVLGEIAAAHGVAPTAVALAFLMAEGHAVIPASGNPAHLRENLAAHDVRLDTAEMARVRALDQGLRTIDPAKSPRWDD